MSHSMRQKLLTAERYDVQNCALQIANIVAADVMTCDQVEPAIYSYDLDGIEKFDGSVTNFISEKMQGEFFDSFSGIEIDVRVTKSEKTDIDGYYYHTLSSDIEDGLIDVIVSLSDSTFGNTQTNHLRLAIQSVLAHEMQHVVQRCGSHIDMAQVHKDAQGHLEDLREIDARVEEVLCGMQDETDSKTFEARIISYLKQYFLRNKVDGISLADSAKNHIQFYSEKILGYCH